VDGDNFLCSLFSDAVIISTIASHDRMVNECEAAWGMRIGREIQSQCHFVHHKSYMPSCGIEPRPDGGD
jgi:hypothetical protein